MGRIDALAKVLGQKVFVRDLRPNDIQSLPEGGEENWGDETLHALLLRTTYLDRIFTGVNIDILTRYGAAKCFVRTGQNIVNVLDPSESYELDFEFVLLGRGPTTELFLDTNSPAQYVGQPVGIMIFDQLSSYLDAEREQLGTRGVVEYGPAINPQSLSGFLDSSPIFDALSTWVNTGERPTNDLLYGGQGIKVGEQHDARFSTLNKSINNGTTVRISTTTPTVDPSFLEPDSGLGRVSRLSIGKFSLTLYAPTQSPNTDEDHISKLFGPIITRSKIDLRTMQLGGGFGGRDFSVFPTYAALAAFLGQGVPVRLTLDRYEQFLSGTKRHACACDVQISHADDGHLLGIVTKFVMDGGSQQDLSSSVKGLALHSSGGAYRFDHWDLRALSMRNRGPLSGSMRGFGIPQVLFNIEQCIDQVAHNLGHDPISYRQTRVLQTSDLDADDQILYHDIRNEHVLDVAFNHPLWVQRQDRQTAINSDTLLHGVGFAMAMEAYGTSSDGVSVCITLNENHELVLHTEVVEMGQGATTGLAELFIPVFGVRADQVVSAAVEQLVRPVKSKSKSEIFAKVGTTSGSKSMFFHGHVLDTLLRLWIARVWAPAAASVWGIDANSFNPSDLSFDGQRRCKIPQQPAIDWADLCTAVLATNKARIWGHGSYRGVWSWSEFASDSGQPFTAWLDALSLLPHTKWPSSRDLLDVTQRVLPNDPRYGDAQRPTKTKRSLYASGAWLVGVEVHLKTGVVRITDAVCVLDAGDRANDSLVKGQVEGGFVQGVGFALTEEYPAGPVGAQRAYNFHNYAIPRLSHMPERMIETVFIDMPEDEQILNPIGTNDPAPPPPIRKKGIAEITITPVAPAIANAVFNALSTLPAGGLVGTRLLTLPITPEAVRHAIKEAGHD